jgi:PPM family protein phosphatase
MRRVEKEPSLTDRGRVEDETRQERQAEAHAARAAAGGIETRCVLRVFGMTDVGRVREQNEDAFVMQDLEKPRKRAPEGTETWTVGAHGALLGVCDGMGGAAAGEVASAMAVEDINREMMAPEPPATGDELAARLLAAVQRAARRVFEEAEKSSACRGMGTTATFAALLGDELFLAQVGDSRAYVLRGPRLVQVTRDQSLVADLVAYGHLTEEEAESFEHRNVILQALGTSEVIDVALTRVSLRRGDTILLCTDGLTGALRDDAIRDVVATASDPFDACDELVRRANAAGGEDNVTVIVATLDRGFPERTDRDIEQLGLTTYGVPSVNDGG